MQKGSKEIMKNDLISKREVMRALGIVEERDRRKQAGLMATAAITGALVGAAAGVMLAPKRGREIREDLLDFLPWFSSGTTMSEADLAALGSSQSSEAGSGSASASQAYTE